MTTAVQTPPTGPAAKPANSRFRVIAASLIGTTIEFYDFYVYATAAVLVFPHLFFPSDDPTTSLLTSFATFGAAMVARPVGAVIFGHFGDRFGRKATLVASLLTMGIATFLIGVLPTYGQVGVLAGILLLVMRLAQGFALGGEWSGAALVATENAPAGKRALYGTFPQLGAPIGFIIANGLFLAINFSLPGVDGAPSEAFLEWGWRIPFLASAVMVIIGLWVRLKLVESASFEKAQAKGALKKFPLGETFRRYWKQIILGTFIMLATYVLFYLLTSFLLSYGTKATDSPDGVPGLGFRYTDFVIMQIVGVVFFGIFTVLAGPIADRIGRRKVLIGVTAAIIVFGALFPVFLLPRGEATLPLTVAFLIIGFALMGSTFGPMGALLPELFPTQVRYTGSAVAYNVSSILGAALAPLVAVVLWAWGDGNPWLVGLYLSGAGILTLIALILSRETKDVDYEATELTH
ncbi:MFS transporter [Microbacterium marinilacus]|uniref:MFS transporter n=1 Tax=Microbacterium marinilacus TaxID=415209 RepID=A0ABP7BAW3_9MICO|nr:MFS transporter [Microbacterium marinilacus]MBY0687121.1 MHS family MFS transporter [Microbacterium marinilacus]